MKALIMANVIRFTDTTEVGGVLQCVFMYGLTIASPTNEESAMRRPGYRNNYAIM